MIQIDLTGKLKVCKKHGTLPRLVQKPRDPYSIGLLGTYGRSMHYVCDACETEREEVEHQPLIDEWNRKQEPLDPAVRRMELEQRKADGETKRRNYDEADE